MADKANQLSCDAVIKCRMSHANLFVPKPNEQGTLTYNVTCVIPPDLQAVELPKLRQALYHAMVNKFGPDRSRWPSNDAPWRKPAAVIRKVEERDSLSEFHNKGGYMFIGPNCYNDAPEVVEADGRTRVTNARDAYSGRWAFVAVNAYWFGDKPGSKQKGLTFGLNAVQLMEHDEPLSGRKNASGYFQPQQIEASSGGDAFGGRFGGAGSSESDPFGGFGGGGGGSKGSDNPFA